MIVSQYKSNCVFDNSDSVVSFRHLVTYLLCVCVNKNKNHGVSLFIEIFVFKEKENIKKKLKKQIKK